MNKGPITIAAILTILVLVLGVCALGAYGLFGLVNIASVKTSQSTDSLQEIQVEDVQIQIGVGSPIPVDIFVSGTWPGLCAQVAEIRQQMNGEQIDISILASEGKPDCPPDMLGVPFRIALPINVVELPEGMYNVSVNGVSASFQWPSNP